jgi:hypothetical protein
LLRAKATKKIDLRSQSLCPSTIVPRAVKNRVNVERFADNREEDPVGKTICENAPNVSVAMNDAE